MSDVFESLKETNAKIENFSKTISTLREEKEAAKKVRADLILNLYERVIKPVAENFGYKVNVDVSRWVDGEYFVDFEGHSRSFAGRWVKSYADSHFHLPLKILMSKEGEKTMILYLEKDKLIVDPYDDASSKVVDSKDPVNSLTRIVGNYREAELAKSKSV